MTEYTNILVEQRGRVGLVNGDAIEFSQFLFP